MSGKVKRDGGPVMSVKRKKNRDPPVPASYCGLSIYAVALLGFTVIILCNWLIDFEYYYRQLIAFIKREKFDDIEYFSSIKQPPTLQKDWISTATTSSDAVKTVLWDAYLLKNLTTQKNPIKFKHPRIKSWPMFNWDLFKIANESGILLNGTRFQPQPVFVLGQEREKGGMIGSVRDHPVTLVNMSLMQFLATSFDKKSWLYWTGELSNWEHTLGSTKSAEKFNVSSETVGSSSSNGNVGGATTSANRFEYNDWRDFRVFEDSISGSNPHDSEEDGDDGIWRPMVWLSHPGVVAQTHYDTQHNMFVQVLGTKRFLLFAPGTELYSYPNIHRSYRQSQVHLEEKRGSLERFPYVHPSNVTAIEVVMHPGDILYIPPYWQHRVESTTLSMSLSILSPSYVEAAIAEVYWEVVPFGEFQATRDLRARAVQLYLSLLIGQLPRNIVNATLQEFAQQLFATRFASLNIKHQMYPLKQQDGGLVCFEPADMSVTALLDMHREKFRQASSKVVGMLNRIDAQAPVKVVFLRDYVEQIVRWAVGPDYTARFISECLH